jgi:hypothetical protein
MRIRRKIIAPVILAIAATGPIAIAPALAIVSTATPAAVPAAASTVTPDTIYHM